MTSNGPRPALNWSTQNTQGTELGVRPGPGSATLSFGASAKSVQGVENHRDVYIFFESLSERIVQLARVHYLTILDVADISAASQQGRGKRPQSSTATKSDGKG